MVAFDLRPVVSPPPRSPDRKVKNPAYPSPARRSLLKGQQETATPTPKPTAQPATTVDREPPRYAVVVLGPQVPPLSHSPRRGLVHPYDAPGQPASVHKQLAPQQQQTQPLLQHLPLPSLINSWTEWLDSEEYALQEAQQKERAYAPSPRQFGVKVEDEKLSLEWCTEWAHVPAWRSSSEEYGRPRPRPSPRLLMAIAAASPRRKQFPRQLAAL